MKASACDARSRRIDRIKVSDTTFDPELDHSLMLMTEATFASRPSSNQPDRARRVAQVVARFQFSSGASGA
jgi:hypothetical protein